MSHRIAQIESTLKRQIAKVLATQVADPRIVGMISVTQVSVSPDMKHATVYVSVVPQKYQSRTVRGLNTAAGFIGSKVAKQMTMRKMPRLFFKLDSSLKQQAEVFGAIARGIQREDLGENAESDSAPAASARMTNDDDAVPDSDADAGVERAVPDSDADAAVERAVPDSDADAAVEPAAIRDATADQVTDDSTIPGPAANDSAARESAARDSKGRDAHAPSSPSQPESCS